MAGTIPGSSPGTAKTLRGASIIARVGVTCRFERAHPTMRFAALLCLLCISASSLRRRKHRSQRTVDRALPPSIQRIGRSRSAPWKPLFVPISLARCRQLVGRAGRRQRTTVPRARQPDRGDNNPGPDRRCAAARRRVFHRNRCGLRRASACPLVARDRRDRHRALRCFNDRPVPAARRDCHRRPVHRGPDAGIALPRRVWRVRRSGPDAQRGDRRSARLRFLAAPRRSSRARRVPRTKYPSRNADGWHLRFSPARPFRFRARSTGCCAATSGRHLSWAQSASPARRLTMAIVLLLTVALSLAPRPQLAGLARMPWWGWLGAFCGATYVTTVFAAIPTSALLRRSA